ncbi:MAG: lyase [Acidobacteria bacterium]|nr:lyase [Acidobacteriota bacterium]
MSACTTRRLGLIAASLLLGPTMWARDAKINVTIEEWDVPTKNSRPHDPAYAPDGSAWYTGQMANVLGRLDPATGVIKEYALPTPQSGPHGLVADKEGNIWYTGNFATLVGKLDPKTGKVTEYRMPDPRAKDPHTPIFDQQGVLWFTVQGGNFVGRLDSATGKIDLKQPPSPNARPYGIVVNSKGVPFFDLFNTNKIGSIDPKTLEITEYGLPDGARPRRIAIDANDLVYYTDYARGFLGRLDPATRQVKEFASPGGPISRPYGITPRADGTIWYSESGVEPNTLVRFDPKTESFQKWTIPSGGGVVRHMVTAPNGDLWLACSGVNKIARARIVATSE